MTDVNVSRLRVGHADGSRLMATGEDAREWGAWLDGGVGMAVAHGMEPPEVTFDEQPEWRGDVDA